MLILQNSIGWLTNLRTLTDSSMKNLFIQRSANPLSDQLDFEKSEWFMSEPELVLCNLLLKSFISQTSVPSHPSFERTRNFCSWYLLEPLPLSVAVPLSFHQNGKSYCSSQLRPGCEPKENIQCRTNPSIGFRGSYFQHVKVRFCLIRAH